MATTTKEIAVGKRAKISEAQQSTLLAVLIASLFLGVAICLVSYFIKQISFNTEIIMEQEQQIVKYSNVIKNIGVCKKPNGNTYSSKELEECTPDAIEISQIPDSDQLNRAWNNKRDEINKKIEDTKKINAKDIFIMTLTPTHKYNIIKKQECSS